MKKNIILIKNSAFWDCEFYKKQINVNLATEEEYINHYLNNGWKNYSPSYSFTQEFPKFNNKIGEECPLLAYEKRIKFNILEKEQLVINSFLKQPPKFNINYALNIIENSDIEIVSFDIFDTLLERNSILPTDVFYFVNNVVKEKYNEDFINYRLTAESELNDRTCSLDDIYTFIKKKYNLSEETTKLLMEEEIKCEKLLLQQRNDIKMIYDCAIKNGKKIIAISDMYLSSSVLKDILNDKGYTQIDKIYVSNEHYARKDNGSLYKVVLEKEQQDGGKILHIGDNLVSDYYMAQKNKIIAIYYPSSIDKLFKFSPLKNLFQNKHIHEVINDPIERIILGFAINIISSKYTISDKKKHFFDNFNELITLGLLPIILEISLKIINNINIQSQYDEIYFASRDGYLPLLAYQILSDAKNINGKYLYAGRRAYGASKYDNFIDLINDLSVDANCKFTLNNILDAYIHDEDLKIIIKNNLSKQQLDLNFNNIADKCDIYALLVKYSDYLNEYLIKQKEETQLYYNDIRLKNNRAIIFDCGYSGSISENLMRITNGKIDKIYLWETNKNQSLDLELGTKTYVLLGKTMPSSAFNLVLEELFSPIAPGCVGFRNKQPIFESISFPSSMKTKYKEIEKQISEYSRLFKLVFKDYIKYFSNFQKSNIDFILKNAIINSNHDISLLDDIVFPDPSFLATSYPLSSKIIQNTTFSNPFELTGFENIDNHNIEYANIIDKHNYNIGIHYHLYNTYLYQELLSYLSEFPTKFDLFITISDPLLEQTIHNIFSSLKKNNLNQLEIITVPNRGRDIAPWLIALNGKQENYDLFCHVQGKVSPHFDWGNDWRIYVLDNLIGQKAFTSILNFFKSNNNLGCVFPVTYQPLKDLCVINNIKQDGEYDEISIIRKLCSRMNINKYFTRIDLFFSECSMYWYRPKAFKQLFDLKLDWYEFPKEPISVGGTLAHAIERLPAFIAKYNGYDTLEYSYSLGKNLNNKNIELHNSPRILNIEGKNETQKKYSSIQIKQMIENEKILQSDNKCKQGHIEQLIESERKLQSDNKCKQGHIEQLIESERKLTYNLNFIKKSFWFKIARIFSRKLRKL